MRIAVLMGGTSEERDVSLASGCQVAAALREAGHEVSAVDTAGGALSPGEEAKILDRGMDAAPPDALEADVTATGDAGAFTGIPQISEADLLFLTLHGGEGEDGTVQALLDLSGLPYVGSGMLGCALAMDKDVSKRLFRDARVPTPAWILGNPTAGEVEEELGIPVIVKPASGGSSVRLHLAHDFSELEAALEEAREVEGRAFCEAYVRGREFTVGIIGDETLPVGEIVPANELFDYESKYQPGMAEEIFPADVDHETATELQRLAFRVHKLLRLRDFSRVDFMVDDDGRPWCLEANTLPGMTSNSLLPKAGKAAGLSFPELCDRICRIARRRLEG